MNTSHEFIVFFPRQIAEELLQVYKSIMGLKSVELLEEAYRHILGDLEIAFNTLLEESESDFQCSLVASNPYTGEARNIFIAFKKYWEADWKI